MFYIYFYMKLRLLISVFSEAPLQNLINLRARVFYEQIVNEAQPSWLSLVENEDSQ